MSRVPVAAVILAGGDGGRIGTPKLYLRVDEENSLERLYRILRSAGCSPIIAVVQDRFGVEVSRTLAGARVVTIPDADAPMFESVRAGVGATLQDRPTMILPVDHLFVKEETLRSLIGAAQEYPGAVIKPVYEGCSGHPVILPPAIVREVRSAEWGMTLRGLIRGSRVAEQFVQVGDAGVVRNVNTLSDLAEAERP